MVINPLIIRIKPMHNLRQNFDTALPIVQELIENDINKAGNVPRAGPKPKFSDVEVIPLRIHHLTIRK